MVSEKNFAEVLIAGKVITLTCYESEEYLQRLATYLNHKMTECKNSDGYCRQNATMQSILLALNIGDDYFKAKKMVSALESDIETKDKEMYDLKHDLISIQIKLENAEKMIETLKAENNDLQKEQIKLQAQMDARKK